MLLLFTNANYCEWDIKSQSEFDSFESAVSTMKKKNEKNGMNNVK